MSNSIHAVIEDFVATAVDKGLIPNSESDSTRSRLRLFEAQYNPITAIFSRLIYEEVIGMLSSEGFVWHEDPNISIIIACHSAPPEYLEAAAVSACSQVGINIEVVFSADRTLTRDISETVYVEKSIRDRYKEVKSTILLHGEHLGVGACRNYGFQAASGCFLTALDDDDVFHPLRCLHAYLALKQLNVDWVGLGYSRYSHSSNKLFLVNKRMSGCGHNSFLAKKTIFDEYGYLAPLHRHEDTEYMQRLTFYGARMAFAGAVGHYLSTEIRPGYISLSTDGRTMQEAIKGHSYIEGTYECAITPSREMINRLFADLYSASSLTQIVALFGTPNSLPESIREAIARSMQGD